ncbi:hypothetical protein K2F43_09335 [Clostridium estertheticum]|uniref:hypothetical protein n=1 Tax=Clostridium estertheticum TaxID=238834 RepID=UPI001C6EA776|nr:hypothetical protein [Clostridium estertheticum]MBW9171410.1 hypothetical protein [Clostridium estertheticum]WLC76676.1 hypothetical protein KTC99_07765 [Clostridium estertheticum]
MSDNNNIYYNENNDVMDGLNNITESHSIKDQPSKKHSDIGPLENGSKIRSKKDKTEDNSDGTYKIINFL